MAKQDTTTLPKPVRPIEIVSSLSNRERDALLAYLVGAMQSNDQFTTILHEGVNLVRRSRPKKTA